MLGGEVARFSQLVTPRCHEVAALSAECNRVKLHAEVRRVYVTITFTFRLRDSRVAILGRNNREVGCSRRLGVRQIHVLRPIVRGSSFALFT